jgi:hypothetical protein
MTADGFLDMLAGRGILLVRDGDSIAADVSPDADLACHAQTIRAHKPALLAALALRARIIAAVTVDPANFDRPAYDALWARWYEENAR